MHCHNIVLFWANCLTCPISVEYRVLRHLGEGTFSEVLKAESVKTRQKVAIKCMKSHFDKIE